MFFIGSTTIGGLGLELLLLLLHTLMTPIERHVHYTDTRRRRVYGLVGADKSPDRGNKFPTTRVLQLNSGQEI